MASMAPGFTPFGELYVHLQFTDYNGLHEYNGSHDYNALFTRQYNAFFCNIRFKNITAELEMENQHI